MTSLQANVDKLQPNTRYKFTKSITDQILFSGVFSHYGNENGNPVGRLFFTEVQIDGECKSVHGVLSVPKQFITSIYVLTLFRGFGELNHLIDSY
jgi:hypothetical protein